MRTAILGTRIRERRRGIGVTQAELARRIGISASYMNLIERNKRGIAGPLLRRAAEALNLRLEELDGAAERRLLETLNEIAYSPGLRALGAEAGSAGELIGRYPGWARSLAALARSEREATEASLADFLSSSRRATRPARPGSPGPKASRRPMIAVISASASSTDRLPLSLTGAGYSPLRLGCESRT